MGKRPAKKVDNFTDNQKINDKRKKDDDEQLLQNCDSESLKYSVQQRVEIVKTYYRKKRNLEEAHVELLEYFKPNLSIEPTLILQVVKKFEETGSV